MGIAGGGQGCAQEPGTQPQPMPSSKCPFLGSSPVPFNNIPITSAAQRDLLQLGTLVLCMVTVPSMLCRTSSSPSSVGIAPDSKEGTSNPWEQGKNMAWNRLV